MRNKKHYESLLSSNPNTTIGFSLAADMIYAAGHDIINRAEAHGGEEWREIARSLKRKYGENLNVDEVRREMASVQSPLSSIIIRNVPESVRRGLKSRAAAEGKSMQGVILELITRYVSEG